MKILVVLLLITMPILLLAQKNKKADETKVVITSPEAMSQRKALFIVDGMMVTPNDSLINLDSMNPGNIESIRVVKGDQAILQYGDAGKHGVILVTTRTTVKKEPLYILDGVRIKSMEGLNTDDIESIQVLKGKENTSEYGDEGEAGVVLISTRKLKK